MQTELQALLKRLYRDSNVKAEDVAREVNKLYDEAAESPPASNGEKS